jgi:2-polyprenyl-3-methyl-5-hydroxy-6-metoxy-1,4-benzoquinol methylase
MMVPFVSPASGARLRLNGTSLVADSGERFPISRGIPRFVLGAGYVESFGLQWNIHTRTQLDSHTRAGLSAVRLERCLGFAPSRLAGQSVLEAGCGAGRFTEILVGAGALVHAIDLSEAVEANRRNIGARPNYVVAQADLLHPPFAAESFDVVLCLGVLQHTPSPEASLAALWRMVKPGGVLVVDHYTWTLSRVTKLAPLYRAILKRLAPAQAKRITDALADVFFPLHWRVRSWSMGQRILSRVSPCLAYCHKFPLMSRELHKDWCRLDTFDELTDRHKHLRTAGQLRRLFERLGAADVATERRSSGVVEARGRKLTAAEQAA